MIISESQGRRIRKPISDAGNVASDLGLEISRKMDIQFAMLDKIIKVLSEAKKAGELDKWTARVKEGVLIKKAGLSKEAAESYINAALERI